MKGWRPMPWQELDFILKVMESQWQISLSKGDWYNQIGSLLPTNNCMMNGVEKGKRVESGKPVGKLLQGSVQEILGAYQGGVMEEIGEVDGPFVCLGYYIS